MNLRSPIVLSSTTVIPRPAHEAAEFVLDWGNDPLWRSQVTRFVVEPAGRAVAGQRLVEHLRFAGIPFRTPTVIDAAEALAASYSGGSAAVRVAGWRRLSAINEASCRVHIHTEIQLTGLLAPLAPALAPGYRRTDAADVARLASVMQQKLE